jgi:hypothetical protein
VVRFAYEDLMAYVDRPSAEEAAQGEQAIQEMQQVADSGDPQDLIATVTPCEPGSRTIEACLTVTPNWERASNRQQVAADLWKRWADICTQRGLAEQADDCRIELHETDGDLVGGSGEDDGSRVWVKEN